MSNVFFKIAITGWILTMALVFVIKLQGDFNEKSIIHKALICSALGSFGVALIATIISIWVEY